MHAKSLKTEWSLKTLLLKRVVHICPMKWINKTCFPNRILTTLGRFEVMWTLLFLKFSYHQEVFPHSRRCFLAIIVPSFFSSRKDSVITSEKTQPSGQNICTYKRHLKFIIVNLKLKKCPDFLQKYLWIFRWDLFTVKRN